MLRGEWAVKEIVSMRLRYLIRKIDVEHSLIPVYNETRWPRLIPRDPLASRVVVWTGDRPHRVQTAADSVSCRMVSLQLSQQCDRLGLSCIVSGWLGWLMYRSSTTTVNWGLSRKITASKSISISKCRIFLDYRQLSDFSGRITLNNFFECF